jgi:hypothetical protein
MSDRPTFDEVSAWTGRHVRDPQGEDLGKLDGILLDGETDRPAYARVRSGLLGRREHLVPLEGLEPEGDVLRSRWPAAQVHDGPQIDTHVAPTPDQAAALREHFRLDLLDQTGPAEGTEVERFEEEPRVVGSERQAAERVVVRKDEVTREEQVEVPVRKEVVQLETDPLPPGRIESIEPVDEEPGTQRAT